MKKKLFGSRTVAAVILLTLCAVLLLQPVGTEADTPYKTYTVDGYGSTIKTQTAYLPYSTITKIGEENLKQPTDFALLDDGFILIQAIKEWSFPRWTPSSLRPSERAS